MRVTAPALDPPTSPQSPQTTNPGSTTPGQQLDNACKTCRWYDEPDIEAAARDLIDDAIQTAARYPAGTVLRMQYHRDRQQWLYTDDDRWLYIDDGD